MLEKFKRYKWWDRPMSWIEKLTIINVSILSQADT